MEENYGSHEPLPKDIHIAKFDSPLGTLLAGATQEGLCFMEFADSHHQDAALKAFCEKWNLEAKQEGNAILHKLGIQLEAYFLGTSTQFDIPLVLLGSPFQKEVWVQLLAIPFGQTISYESLSLKMKQPLAIRAIAQANGKNPIAIIVPCHRVIGKHGAITGYAGGIWRKQYLLEHESSYPRQTKLSI